MKRILSSLVAVLFTVAAANAAFAVQLANSYAAGAWHPATPSDVNFIGFTDYSVYNSDTVSSRRVRNSVGTGQVAGGNYTTSVTGKNNGFSLSCTVKGVNLATGATVSGSNSTFANGIYTLSITMFGVPTGNYAVSVSCSLPPSNGGIVSQIYQNSSLSGP
jgi:hypothetical protein